MNMLAQITQNQSAMSHREIAVLIGKESFHVKRDCEKMLEELEVDPKGCIQNWIHPQNGQTYIEYMLTRDLVETLITGYNIKLRHAVLNRLRELEAQAAKPTKLSRMDLIQLALQAEQENQELRGQVAILTPKAQALDVIAGTTNTYCIRECAKTIGIKESELIHLLIDKKWVYRDASKKLQPMAQYTINGVFTNRTSPVIKNYHDGQERVFLHMRVTAFGLTRITGLVEKARMKGAIAA